MSLNTKKITPEIFEKQYLGYFESGDPRYIVYRLRNKIYFIDQDREQYVIDRLEASKRAGFGVASTLNYMSEYIVDTDTYNMIKNRYPEQPWPKQIMEEIFSGVGNEIELR